MLKFLNERTAAVEIKSLLARAPKAKLAVAFWGKEASETLGLPSLQYVPKILCNLDSGACNPFEIEKLIERGSVKSNPRLHGKLYWTPIGMVVGSSNASTNGLATEPPWLDGWAEANILTDESSALLAAEAWFREQEKGAYLVDSAALARAKPLWNARSRAKCYGVSLTNDLLAACAGSIEAPAWKKVKVAFWTDDLSARGRASWNAATNEIPALKKAGSYEGWSDGIFAGDWIIDVPCFEKDSERITYGAAGSPLIQRGDLTFTFGRPAITLGGFGAMKLSPAERKELIEISGKFLGTPLALKDGGALVGIVDVVKALGLVGGRGQNERAVLLKFEKEMRRIYDVAVKELKHNPTGYLGLLKTRGALGTAKKLLADSTVSRGFLRLHKDGRLDLTVEALVLDDQWKSLFTDEERRRASRRLKQYG